ncbi:MAG: NADH-quinone oxidoreductase subunit NuoE [Lentisphaerae bacterium]|nr:NADH-quinone oxidoreductase subunit NuoE [Lentisphaerota bacterium]
MTNLYETKTTAILDKNGRSKDVCVKILQDIQSEFGYLPMEAMRFVAQNSEITERQLFGVATFYDQFTFSKPGEHIIRVCHGTACHVNGAAQITSALERHLKIKEDETTDDGLFTLQTVACLGCCSLAPVMMVDGTVYGRLTPEGACKIIDQYKTGKINK